MGLEAMELLLATEHAFGITLTEKETLRCETPRQLIDLVFSKLPSMQHHVCLSQRAFYLLRRTLQTVFAQERHQITLNTPLRNIIPPSHQKIHWLTLKTALRARVWPELSRPQWLHYVMTTLVLLTGIGTGITIQWVAPGYNPFFTFCFALFSAIFIGYIVAWLTRPFKHYIPCYAGTVRDLIPLAQTSDELRWTRDNVVHIMRRLVIKQLGLEELDYREDARFVEELGMY